jgi:hypothetical protein
VPRHRVELLIGPVLQLWEAVFGAQEAV